MVGEPVLFHFIRLDFAVYAICLAHLTAGILILATSVVGHDINYQGVIISAGLQAIYGVFQLIGIFASIVAGVGMLYHIDFHLDLYFVFLIFSAILEASIFIIFLIYGQGCTTVESKANHLAAHVYCGIRNGMALVVVALLVLFALVSLYIVAQAQQFLRTEHFKKMVPHIHKASEQFGAKDHHEAIEDHSHHDNAAVMNNRPHSQAHVASGPLPQQHAAMMNNHPHGQARMASGPIQQHPFPPTRH